MKRRILAALMALVLCLGLAGTAWAEETQTEIHVSTAEELEAALSSIKSNTKIVLEGKDYVYDHFISLVDAENITLQGVEGTRIISTDADSKVIYLGDCKNVVLDHLVVGHDPLADRNCYAGVIGIGGESEVLIRSCDIFGCGRTGLIIAGSVVTVEESVIRDCSDRIMDVYGTVTFRDCVFSGNGYGFSVSSGHEVAAIKASGPLFFYDCIFVNNKNPSLSEDGEIVTENCIFYGNAWGGDNVSAPPEIPTFGAAEPQTPPAEEPDSSATAAPTAATVLVNGEQVAVDAYSIGGNNYFKLRDLAYVLNGTEKQFEVSWDNAARTIALTSGQSYTADGSEMAAKGSGNQTAALSTAKTLVDGEEVSLTAYSIGGNNYFKLRDLGRVFDFGVDWDNDTRTITIDTSTGYTE